MRKKDQINLESKIKTVRFIGEKFVMCKLPSTNNGLCELWEYSHGKTYQQDFILTDVYSNIEWKKVSLINNNFFFNSTDTKSVSVVIGLSF